MFENMSAKNTNEKQLHKKTNTSEVNELLRKRLLRESFLNFTSKNVGLDTYNNI